MRQVYFYCVDVSEFAVNKLGDRGSLSARGIVTNVQDFVVLLQKSLSAMKKYAFVKFQRGSAQIADPVFSC